MLCKPRLICFFHLQPMSPWVLAIKSVHYKYSSSLFSFTSCFIICHIISTGTWLSKRLMICSFRDISQIYLQYMTCSVYHYSQLFADYDNDASNKLFEAENLKKIAWYILIDLSTDQLKKKRKNWPIPPKPPSPHNLFIDIMQYPYALFMHYSCIIVHLWQFNIWQHLISFM